MTSRVLILLLLAVTLLPGCARQLGRIELAVNELSRDQRRLEQQQERLLKEVEALRTAAEQQDREGAASLAARIGSLERTLQEMRAMSEEQQDLLRSLRGRMDLATVPPRAAAEEPTDGEGDDPGEVDGGSGGTDIFDAAFADYTRGNFGLARQGFQELLARHPRGGLADDAAYWVGETWYSEGDFARARDAFVKVLERFPSGDKVAPALLKLGYSYLELDEEDRAAAAFERLRSEHPDSDEALIAQHKLDSLDPR